MWLIKIIGHINVIRKWTFIDAKVMGSQDIENALEVNISWCEFYRLLWMKALIYITNTVQLLPFVGHVTNNFKVRASGNVLNERNNNRATYCWQS